MADLDVLEQDLSTAALNELTPTIRQDLQQGLAIAGDLSPAYAVMSKVAQGGAPNPQEIVAGLAGAATAITPLAGAAMLAAGELAVGFSTAVQDLLKSLGLISDGPKPVPFVGLVEKGKDPIPSGGPGSLHPDPLWRSWNDFARWWWPSGGATSYGWYPSAGRTDVGAQAGDVGAILVDGLMHELWMTSSNYKAKPGSSRSSALVVTPVPKNAFEAFALPLLQKDIEHWANANPYIDPRALVLALIDVWNAHHASSPNDVTYEQSERQGDGFVPFLLGSHGDITAEGAQGTRKGNRTVHLGPFDGVRATVPAPSTRAGTRAAPNPAAAAAAAAAGSIAAQKAIAAAKARAKAPAPMSDWWLMGLFVAMGLGALALARRR